MLSLLFGLLMLGGGSYLLYWSLNKHTIGKGEWMKGKSPTITFYLSYLDNTPKITVGYILSSLLLIIGLILLLIGIF